MVVASQRVGRAGNITRVLLTVYTHRILGHDHRPRTRSSATGPTVGLAGDIASLTAGYGLIIADECHHIPAKTFEQAVSKIPARRFLGLTATPYCRDKLDDLIPLQVRPARHTITLAGPGPARTCCPVPADPSPCCTCTRRPTDTTVTPSFPPWRNGRRLAADEHRTRQVIADVLTALGNNRNCLILTNWISHLERLAGLLRDAGHDPVILRGGMGAKNPRSGA